MVLIIKMGCTISHAVEPEPELKISHTPLPKFKDGYKIRRYGGHNMGRKISMSSDIASGIFRLF
jgi:hypothetical protein